MRSSPWTALVCSTVVERAIHPLVGQDPALTFKGCIDWLESLRTASKQKIASLPSSHLSSLRLARPGLCVPFSPQSVCKRGLKSVPTTPNCSRSSFQSSYKRFRLFSSGTLCMPINGPVPGVAHVYALAAYGNAGSRARKVQALE